VVGVRDERLVDERPVRLAIAAVPGVRLLLGGGGGRHHRGVARVVRDGTRLGRTRRTARTGRGVAVGGDLAPALEVLLEDRDERREDGQDDAGQHQEELHPDDPAVDPDLTLGRDRQWRRSSRAR
jgi:hypothetical protein